MSGKTKIVPGSDMFCRNFCYLKRKYSLSRLALARLLEITVDKVRYLEKGEQNFAVEAHIVERLAELYRVDITALLTVDLENPQPPPCGPDPA